MYLPVQLSWHGFKCIYVISLKGEDIRISLHDVELFVTLSLIWKFLFHLLNHWDFFSFLSFFPPLQWYLQLVPFSSTYRGIHSLHWNNCLAAGWRQRGTIWNNRSSRRRYEGINTHCIHLRKTLPLWEVSW